MYYLTDITFKIYYTCRMKILPSQLPTQNKALRKDKAEKRDVKVQIRIEDTTNLPKSY